MVAEIINFALSPYSAKLSSFMPAGPSPKKGSEPLYEIRLRNERYKDLNIYCLKMPPAASIVSLIELHGTKCGHNILHLFRLIFVVSSGGFKTATIAESKTSLRFL